MPRKASTLLKPSILVGTDYKKRHSDSISILSMDCHHEGRTASTPKYCSGHCDSSLKNRNTKRVEGVASASSYQIPRTREWSRNMERRHHGKPFSGDCNKAQPPQRHRTIRVSLIWRPSCSSYRHFKAAIGSSSAWIILEYLSLDDTRKLSFIQQCPPLTTLYYRQV